VTTAAAGQGTLSAAILASGSELVADRADTNGPEIARRLALRGVRVRARGILPDDVAQLTRALLAEMGEGGLVLLVGGLGPTRDDVTREAVTAATGLRLRQDALAVARLEELARRRGSAVVSPQSLRQALVPEGSTVIANLQGAVPGAVVTVKGAVLVLLPGPPGELVPMLDPALDEALRQARERLALSPGPPVLSTTLRLAGTSESAVAQALEAVSFLAAAPGASDVDVSYLAEPGDLSVTLRCRDAARLAAAVAAARAALLPHVYSDDGRSLPEVLVPMLRARGETVTCAESCTGGLLAGAITSVPGSSDVFRASFVTYANEAKSAVLGVAPALLLAHGAVSAEVACAMALGARRAAQADWALAVTGVAGPDGGTPEKPVGLVFVALAHPDGSVESWRLVLAGGRDEIRRRSVTAALDGLRKRGQTPFH
jgi:nicotinamide-nucleotide amidase